jgi:hypothetical protein
MEKCLVNATQYRGFDHKIVSGIMVETCWKHSHSHATSHENNSGYASLRRTRLSKSLSLTTIKRHLHSRQISAVGRVTLDCQ